MGKRISKPSKTKNQLHEVGAKDWLKPFDPQIKTGAKNNKKERLKGLCRLIVYSYLDTDLLIFKIGRVSKAELHKV